MRARTLLLLLLAVILAGGTALLARNWLAQTKEAIDQPPMPIATPARSVLVARADIKRGQILRREDAVWQIWPEGGLDKNYVVLGGPGSPESFKAWFTKTPTAGGDPIPDSKIVWVAKNPIAGGEPITEGKVINSSDRGFLAAVLRPGMRAISVPVTITSGISGFIFPGDQVDLMMTYTVPPNVLGGSTYDHKAAETMLRDVRVIAIDQRLESKAGEAVPAHTATFEVTAKQSEAIVLASEIGKLTLSLRSLVPDPQETPVANQRVVLTAAQKSPDSSIAGLATYTLDDEINPLLPKAVGGMVTILRGGGKASESTATQPAAKGS